MLGVLPAVTFRRWAVEGRHSKPIPEQLVASIHLLVLAAHNIYSISSEILAWAFGNREISSPILALNIGAIVCQACSSRALCCLEGTRAFGNRHWILSPSLVESLGYGENCFPFKVGEAKWEQRSGTIYWGKARRPSGTALDDIAVNRLSVHGLRCTRLAVNLQNSHLESDWDALAHRAS